MARAIGKTSMPKQATTAAPATTPPKEEQDRQSHADPRPDRGDQIQGVDEDLQQYPRGFRETACVHREQRPNRQESEIPEYDTSSCTD